MPVITYKCPNCDGELVFDPSEQKFCCEYCKSSFTEQEIARQTPPSSDVESTERPNAEQEAFDTHAVEFVCPSCGAQVIAAETTAATSCFYCHNPVVLSGRVSGRYKPDKVIPFRLEKAEVEQKFLAWCKKKKFMKRAFYSLAQREKLTGVYLPFWVVDSTVSGNMRARGHRVRTWRSGDTEYTETKEYELIREADIDFHELPLAGLRDQQMELTQGIYPYDFSGAVNFSMAYLSGFQAEKRKLERVDLEQEEHKILREYTQMLLKQTTSHYGGVTVTSMNTHVLREHWSYLLLPVWIMTYRYQNKDYYYAMNGQTGKVCGKVPLSFGRLAILFGIVSAALFLILLLGGLLL